LMGLSYHLSVDGVVDEPFSEENAAAVGRTFGHLAFEHFQQRVRRHVLVERKTAAKEVCERERERARESAHERER